VVPASDAEQPGELRPALHSHGLVGPCNGVLGRTEIWAKVARHGSPFVLLGDSLWGRTLFSAGQGEISLNPHWAVFLLSSVDGARGSFS